MESLTSEQACDKVVAVHANFPLNMDMFLYSFFMPLLSFSILSCKTF